MERFISLRSIVLNNEGVKSFNQGRFEDAISYFTTTLGLLQPYLEGDGDESKTTENHNDNATDNTMITGTTISGASRDEFPRCTFIGAASVSDESWRIRSIPNTNSNCKMYHDRRFIFRDPIQIPPEASKRFSSRSFYAKISQIAMFNLALSFHLSALELISPSRLVRAKRVYELAYQAYLQEYNPDVALVYSLAVMNNLGLVNELIGDDQKANLCFEQMLGTIMFLVESQETTNVSHFEGFMSNVVHLISPAPAPASAA